MNRWVLTLFVVTSLTTAAWADEVSQEAHAVAEESPDAEASFPFGASVLGEISVGSGTFTPGPASRPYVNLLTRLDVDYTFEDLGLVLASRLTMNVNAVETADSSNTVPHEFKVGDLRISAELNDLLTWDAIGLGVSPVAALTFPTSPESRHAGKLFGMKLGVSVSAEPLPWLVVDARTSVTKNLNRYTNTVLQAEDFDLAPLSRAGGAESVADGRVATGSGVTSWYATWGAGATFTVFDVLSFVIDFEMLHLFSYQQIPLDEYSSPYAHAGRGQSDLMYGTLEVGWDVMDNLSLALGTLVEQSPLTADNTGPRFPFWDTTNGSANRQVFYLNVAGSF
jgi:hypothetical protein